MDEHILRKIEELERKVDATLEAVEKTRKYFMWFLILSLLALFLPLIGMMLALPYFLTTLTGTLSGGLNGL